jgi:hypothetical protein
LLSFSTLPTGCTFWRSIQRGLATAPIRPVIRFAFSMVALGVVMLTLLAVYFFLHRRQQAPEIELHTQESAAKKMSASA